MKVAAVLNEDIEIRLLGEIPEQRFLSVRDLLIPFKWFFVDLSHEETEVL